MAKRTVIVTKTFRIPLKGRGHVKIDLGRGFKITDTLWIQSDGTRKNQMFTKGGLNDGTILMSMFDVDNEGLGFPVSNADIMFNLTTGVYQATSKRLRCNGEIEFTYQHEETINDDLLEIAPGVWRVSSLDALAQLACTKRWRSDSRDERCWSLYCDRFNTGNDAYYPLLVVDYQGPTRNSMAYSITRAKQVNIPHWEDNTFWVKEVER